MREEMLDVDPRDLKPLQVRAINNYYTSAESEFYICPICRKKLNINEDFFNSKGRANRKQAYCKTCMTELAKINRSGVAKKAGLSPVRYLKKKQSHLKLTESRAKTEDRKKAAARAEARKRNQKRLPEIQKLNENLKKQLEKIEIRDEIQKKQKKTEKARAAARKRWHKIG